MNQMHEYKIKSFSKTLEFNPDFQKQVFQPIDLKKILKTFCIKIQEHVILDGHNKNTHNKMYQV